MLIIKKLVFSLPFLIFFYLTCFEFQPFLKDLYLIFSLDLTVLFKLLLLSFSILISSLFFVLFSTMADDWKLVTPAVIVALLAPIILLPQSASFISAVLVLIIFILNFFMLSRKLKTYITFEPTHLFTPSVKSLTTLLILFFSLTFYQVATERIKTEGFKIPDSLLNTALKFASPELPAVQGVSIAQSPSLTSDQLNLLKQNPSLLKQYGLDPSVLDNIQPTKSSQTKSSNAPQSEALKPFLQTQISSFLKPFEAFIAPVLALLFFVSLQSISSFEAILLSPLIWLIFKILEKSGYIHFEKEMREVKKLVV